jgi:hypothetical protein
MELNNNQMLLLAVAAVALYFFMKHRQCSKQEKFETVDQWVDFCTKKHQKKFCKNNTPKCIEGETKRCKNKIKTEYDDVCYIVVNNLKNGKGDPNSCAQLQRAKNFGFCKDYSDDMYKYCKIKK